MRLRIALVLLIAAAARADSPAPATRSDALGFAHIEHAGKVLASGKPPQDCTGCHDMRADGTWRGQPGHTSCFASCHQDADPATLPAAGSDAELVCAGCHAPSALAAARTEKRPRPAAIAPSTSPDKDFALQLSHKSHAGVPGDCRACHAIPGSGRSMPSGHALCGGCHARGKAGPELSSCEGCHLEAVGPLRLPVRDAGVYDVRATFSHRSHQGYGARSCRPCHEAAAGTADEWVPTPKKDDCAGCHDGDTAFSMLESACRRCHQKPERTPTAARPDFGSVRFSHADHRAAGESRECSACHGLDRAGRVRALSDHLSCAGSGCHEGEFSRVDSKLCGVCHAGNEPWRSLHLDRMRIEGVEHRVRFSHGAHAGALEVRDCDSCHQMRRGGVLTLVRNHAACTGVGCHDVGGDSGPSIENCQACHTGEPRPARPGRWSVRDAFSHRGHLETEDGARVECAACHTGVWSGSLRPPAKRACMRCHDGEQAFKVTGHQCVRCHSTAERRP